MSSKISPEEQKELIRIMKKLEFPLPKEVFYAWHNVFGIVCAELIVVRKNNGKREFFLEYREDEFFKGWHIQGRVHLPNEKIENTLERVIKDEVQAAVTTPKFFDWFEYPSGKNTGECERGHAFSFVFIAEQKDILVESETRKFFPLDNLPKKILNGHVPVIEKLKKLS